MTSRGSQSFTAPQNPANRDDGVHASEARVCQVIGADSLELYFQPQVETTGSVLRGVEALVRARRQGRQILPGDFIPTIEAAGCSAQLSHWVLEQAVRQWCTWQAQGISCETMAVNLNICAFEEHSVIDSVRDILGHHGMPAWQLEIELTESAPVEHAQCVADAMRALHELGVRLSLDDFGTGYSSFVRLQDYPFDMVKIERRFVQSMPRDRYAFELAQLLCQLAGRLGIQTLAEGVETETQRVLLAQLGCDAWQGYLCAKPMSAQAAGDFLRAGKVHLPVPHGIPSGKA